MASSPSAPSLSQSPSSHPLPLVHQAVSHSLIPLALTLHFCAIVHEMHADSSISNPSSLFFPTLVIPQHIG